MGQMSGLCAFTAEGMGSVAGQGTKILQATWLRGEEENSQGCFLFVWLCQEKKKVPEILPPPYITVHLPPPSLPKEMK